MVSFPRVQISLGPRPGKKSIKRLQDLNLTHCCTLLSEREGAPLIAKVCAQLGTAERPCEWVWLPIEGGNQEALRQTDILSLVENLREAIANTPDVHIYLHCSAGIHRTGFFAYILLRLMGHDSAAALGELADLRHVTSNQVGEERIELADEFVASLATAQ
ncbi:protein-tyrosine phosphatase family protein [Pelagimonas varians]|uniref:protein-tyrosine phosphatase family protein n=1 Tax=Pelagimonas varians TaxID=696760 RepID=UPI000D919014|nr:tyrosine-protein phosphatase [Pelagimonas varians]PYG26428.1 tyrosine phosphatase family protein [Pelagimonas varians]